MSIERSNAEHILQEFESDAFESMQLGDLGYTFSQFCRDNNLHHCMTSSEIWSEVYNGDEPAIVICFEDEVGHLWAGNDTELNCLSVINFCPFCGYKTKIREVKYVKVPKDVI